MKVIILKPSSLGDVVHAMPVLRLLKRQWPQSQVYWWIEAGLAPLLEEDPDLSGLFIFQRKGWRQADWWPTSWATLQAVRAKRFDVVIDLQGLGRSAFFAWLANGALTIGLDNPREGNREGAHLFYDRLAPRSPADTPAVERYLGVLPALGLQADGAFDWLPPRAAAAKRVAAVATTHSGRWVALLPGARWDNKRWPVELFAESAARLAAEQANLKFVVLGSATDVSLGAVIAPVLGRRCLDLTGRTTLPEMIEWLRLADLVIANDTGPMHVAAAMARPLVSIYGPSDPRSTGPHAQLEQVLQARELSCVPCLKDFCTHPEPLACLRAVSPAEVCRLARLTLARHASSLRL